MSTAIKNLEHDHEHIIRLTEVMVRMVQREDAEIQLYETVVDIIRNFADGLHHAKEENHLFPRMTQKGFPSVGGPVGVMLLEHEQGRAYVKGMMDSITAMHQREEGALQQLHHFILGYAELLQNHIHKENNVLFRMADNAFLPEDQQELIREFELVENEFGMDKREDYIRLIDELWQQFPE